MTVYAPGLTVEVLDAAPPQAEITLYQKPAKWLAPQIQFAGGRYE